MPPDPMLTAMLEFYTKRELIRPADALQDLVRNPSTFLRRHPVFIDERPGASAVITAYLTNNSSKGLAKRPGSVLKTKRFHDTTGFYVNCNGIPHGSFPQTRASFQTHYVEMTLSTQPTIWYSLAGGPDIMITCKLSGCSFLVRQAGGSIECAHVKPAGGTTGAELQRNLTQNGVTVYGGDNYNSLTRSVSILGVRRGGGWRIYRQKHEAGTWKILSVEQIYPR